MDDDKNLVEALEIVRNELLKAGDFYFGFLASIESALEESVTCTNIHELAAEILDRIMGEY